MSVGPKPVNPMDRFNQRFAGIRRKNGEQSAAQPEKKDTAQPEKPEDKKQSNKTNDFSQLSELLQNSEGQEKKGDNSMTDTKIATEDDDKKNKITTEMRHELNALGMDDETIGGLDYDDAVKILKDKDELSKTLDEITDSQKITAEMREGLNALGMDDETINGLTYNDAAGILRDKKEINDALDELNTLNITERDAGEKPLVAEHEDLHWIDEKVRDYNKMKEAGNSYIKEILPDKTAGTFTAEVDNGTITYTSKNEASITKGSSYKVFDTMMKEPSNTGKAVRIPAQASEEFKTNLFVAAVLNGHRVNGAEDLTLDEETLNKIGLNEEQKNKVFAALAKKEDKVEEKPAEEKPAEEKPAEEKPAEEKPAEEKSAEEKPAEEKHHTLTPEANNRIINIARRNKRVDEISEEISQRVSAPVYTVRPITIKKARNQGRNTNRLGGESR